MKTFEPDSELVTAVVPARGWERGKFGPRREYGATVTHITGAGPLKRMTEDRFARWRRRHIADEECITLGGAAALIYATVMDAAAHYVVGPDADIYQTAPEDCAAWHVGRKGSRVYEKTHWLDERTEWWMDRWEVYGYASPLDLAEGRLWGPGPYSANGGGVGAEMVWPYDRARTPPTDRQWQAWAMLIRDIHRRRGIPLTVEHTVTHSDAHPRARTRAGAPWDLPPWWNHSTASHWLGIKAGD